MANDEIVCRAEGWLENKRYPISETRDEHTDALARGVLALAAERDAYKRAKTENDDRFMLERDAAILRAEAAEARAAGLERERDEARAFADATNLPNHERVLRFADIREQELRERVIQAEARAAALGAVERAAEAVRRVWRADPREIGDDLERPLVRLFAALAAATRARWRETAEAAEQGAAGREWPAADWKAAFGVSPLESPEVAREFVRELAAVGTASLERAASFEAAILRRAVRWEGDAAEAELAAASYRRAGALHVDAAVELFRTANRARARARELRDILAEVGAG